MEVEPSSVADVELIGPGTPEFQKAFAIKTPSPMVKTDRCVIW